MTTKTEEVKIYYTKGFFCSFGEEMDKAKEKFDDSNYELVCTYPVVRQQGHDDYTILNTMFELFNWIHEGFQPEDKEIGFHRPETVLHTSMSVGDVVEIDNKKYICDSFGWKELKG